MGDPRPARLLAPVGRLGPVGGLHRGGFRSRQHSRATRSGPPSRGTARRCRRQALTWHRWSAIDGDICQAITEIALEQHVPLTVEEFHTLNRCLDIAIAEAVTEHSRLIAQRRSKEEAERLGQTVPELGDLLNGAGLRFTQSSADRSPSTEGRYLRHSADLQLGTATVWSP